MRRATILAALLAALALLALPASAGGTGLIERWVQQNFGGGISATGASDGEVLTWDSTQKRWEAQAASTTATFAGTTLRLSSNQSLGTNTIDEITFDDAEEVFDVGGWHTESAASRITVASAYNGQYARLWAQTAYNSDPTGIEISQIEWFNSSDTLQRTWLSSNVDADSSGGTNRVVSTPSVLLTTGDYFILSMRSPAASNAAKGGTTGSVTEFSIWIVGE